MFVEAAQHNTRLLRLRRYMGERAGAHPAENALVSDPLKPYNNDVTKL